MANRIKRIGSEERAAKRELRAMGVSDYELDRLYDANYKARARARIFSEKAGESAQFSLQWANILKGVKQAQKQGKSPSEYVQMRKEAYQSAYRLSEAKEVATGGVTSGSSWLARCLSRYSTAEIEAAKHDRALLDVLAGDNESYEHKRYARARELYKKTAGGQAAWDKALSEASEEIAEEEAKNIEVDDGLLWDAFGIDAPAIRAAEKEHDKALKNRQLTGYPHFMETMRKYGGDKWQNA